MSTDRGSLLLWLLVVPLAVMGQLATEVYLPSMPSMAEYFKIDIHLIQLSIAIYVFGFAIGGLFYGGLSDMYGRVPIVMISLVVAVIGGITCAFAFNLDMLYLGRFVQGLGLSGTAVICRSICRDIAKTPDHLSKIGSVVGMASAVALSFAPILGGYVQTYLFWRANFIILLLITILLLVFCWYKLPETNQNIGHTKVNKMFSIYCKILSDREFLRYNFISGATLGGVVAYQTISSKLLQVDVGLSPAHFGFTSVLITLIFLVGGYLNSLIVTRRGFKKMMRFGFYLFMISGILFSLFGMLGYVSVTSVLVAVIFYMLGASIVYPNASTGSMSLYPEHAGVASSLYNCIQMICGALGSTMVSLTHHVGQLSIAILYIGITAWCFFLSRSNAKSEIE